MVEYRKDIIATATVKARKGDFVASHGGDGFDKMQNQKVDNILRLAREGKSVFEIACKTARCSIPVKDAPLKNPDGTDTHYARQLQRFNSWVKEVRAIIEDAGLTPVD